jgi:MSHA biogenesis protein MshM
MYLQHFQLVREPFSTTPDTRFLLKLNNSHSLFNELVKFANSQDTICLVESLPGTGKTTLCRKFLNALRLHSRYHAFELRHAHISKNDLFKSLTDKTLIELDSTLSAKKLARMSLIKLLEEGKRAVIVIDDADALSKSIRKALLRLAATTHHNHKLLRVVMFLNSEVFRPFDEEEVTLITDTQHPKMTLNPVKATDTKTFLEHRLSIAGHSGTEIFTPDAIAIISDASEGKPSIINLLAHKAMMLACQQEVLFVDKEMMKRAVEETDCADITQSSGLVAKIYSTLFGRTKITS